MICPHPSRTIFAAVWEGTFDSALLAGGWNLLSQAGAPCLAACAARGVAVHVAGVFASGLLVDPTEGTYAYQRAPPAMVEVRHGPSSSLVERAPPPAR